MRKEAEKTGAEKRDLTTKIEELHLFNHISDKELKKLRLKKQVRTQAYAHTHAHTQSPQFYSASLDFINLIK